MNLKLVCVALTLSLTPALAQAACGGKHQTTSDCKPGETRDAQTGVCTAAVHS